MSRAWWDKPVEQWDEEDDQKAEMVIRAFGEFTTHLEWKSGDIIGAFGQFRTIHNHRQRYIMEKMARIEREKRQKQEKLDVVRTWG